MGLGKTIQSIGLMLSNPPHADGPRTTVLVCPLSVIASWRMQMHQFVEPGHWTIAEYRGADREATLRQVKRGTIDLLLVSYDTLVSDFKAYEKMLQDAEEEEAERAAAANQPQKKAKTNKSNSLADTWKSRGKKRSAGSDSESDFEMDDDDSDEDEYDHNLPKSMTRKQPAKKPPSLFLFDLPLHRIILDEAHCIRNSGSIRFKAVMALAADRKLCITGTPYVNKVRILC